MQRTFTVMGMRPVSGQIVSVEIVAATPEEARLKAEESGLLLVVVGEIRDPDSAGDDGDAPKPVEE